MRRSKIILAAVILAAVGTALPIAASLQLSWQRTVDAEQERLDANAERALRRAELSYDTAVDALRSISLYRSTPCSKEHIAAMRMLVMSTRSIDQMGYFAEGKMRCNSWGIVTDSIAQPRPDYVMDDGPHLKFDVRPRADGTHPLLSIMLGDHDVLMDPSRFVDVVADRDVQLALAMPDGRLVAQQGIDDPVLLKELLAHPRQGVDDRHFMAYARDPHWLAIALSPRGAIASSLQAQRGLFIPLGIFMAAFVVLLVAWLSQRRLSPRAELALAVEKREFVVHYQPIIALASGICVGAECLVRWQRPDGTLVNPDLFVPLAEQSGLIEPITDQVIAAVVADMGPLLNADRSLHFAINLPPSDMVSGRFLGVLERALRGTGIRTNQIWLEATERGFMDVDAARTHIASARQAGHSVAIDDFGVGYSSLQYLQQLPLDALKIDKSFIDTIGLDAATSAVTPHIIEMAQSLGLLIVAEGIETSAQLDYLVERGVGFGQGWLFSRPLPRDAYIAFHQQRQEQFGRAPEDMQNRRDGASAPVSSRDP